MSEKKIVLLDLDDTILDFHTAERSSITRAFTELGVEVNEAVLRRYSEINNWVWQQLELGAMTREEILVERFRRLFRELGISVSPEAAQTRYEGMLESGHYFVPGAPELLETLSPRYDLYIISNGNARTQAGRLKSADITRYFRGVFISELIGCNKPAREFFERCFAQIPAFRREDAVVVGDSLTSDIRGARNAGITSCWFNPARLPAREDIPADYEFHALCELPGLLERIFQQK